MRIGAMVESFRSGFRGGVEKAAALGVEGVQAYATFGELDVTKVTDAQLKENSAQQYGYYTSDYGATLDKGDQSAITLGRMYDEYKWEFAWEFGNRSRCVRFGVFTKKNWVSHKSLGDYTALYPIPESARTPNPGLEQNPNYK
jgi:hypothetical protein